MQTPVWFQKQGQLLVACKDSTLVVHLRTVEEVREVIARLNLLDPKWDRVTSALQYAIDAEDAISRGADPKPYWGYAASALHKLLTFEQLKRNKEIAAIEEVLG